MASFNNRDPKMGVALTSALAGIKSKTTTPTPKPGLTTSSLQAQQKTQALGNAMKSGQRTPPGPAIPKTPRPTGKKTPPIVPGTPKRRVPFIKGY